jgi:dTDP-4-dehydrorhamnose 3,5-epimerase
MNFNIIETSIKGLKVIEPKAFEDDRGFFFESYKSSVFNANGVEGKILQVNQSFSVKNVVRGLHFQKYDYGQAKLVRCLSGEIYDVAVDLRKNSPTFGQYFGVNLTSQNRLMLYIPIGFAHGFSVLSKTAEVSYDVFGAEYNKASEGGIRFDDPDLNIDWKVEGPIVSEKDLVLPFLKELKEFF